MNYAILDLSGHVLYTTSSFDGRPPVPPEGCTVEEVSRVFPEQPSPWHRFHWPTQSWVDHRGLADLKASKRAEINAAWEAASVGTFEFGGKLIDCSRSSRSDIDGVQAEVALTGALPAGFPGQWKARDNSWLPIPDVATWTQFIKAMVAQGLVNFGKAQALKAQIEASESAQDLDGVVW